MIDRNNFTFLLVMAFGGLLAACDGAETSAEANGNAAATALGDVGVRASTDDNVGGEAAKGCQDRDGDGFGDNCEKGPDCDDSRRSANSEQLEQCGDGFDNDCDSRIEEVRM